MPISLDDTPPAVKKLPSVDKKAIGLNGTAGSALHSQWTYAHRKHSKSDVVKPGYFNDAREFGIRKWDILTVTLGDDPGEAIEFDLRFIDVPVGADSKIEVIVALGETRTFTPVRHDGGPVEEPKPKTAKAA